MMDLRGGLVNLPSMGFVVRPLFLLMVASIPVSVAGVNFFGGLAIICALPSYELWNSKKYFKKNTTAILCLALVILFGLGIVYTSAPTDEAHKFFFRYAKLLLVPVFCPFFRHDDQRLPFVLTAALALTFNALISWGDFLGITQLSDPAYGNMSGDSVFKNHITQGFLFCIGIVLAASLCVWAQKRWQKLILVLIILMFSANLFFVMLGKTGKVTLFAIALWLSIEWLRSVQYSNLTKRLAGLLFFSVITVFSFNVMRIPNTALGSIKSDIETTSNSGAVTSQGLRLQLYVTGLKIASKHPIFGSGTGSVITEYKIFSDLGVTPVERATSTNLHNEYLMQEVQIGIPGLLLFLVMLWIIFKYSFELPQWQQIALRGGWICFSLGCMFNSYLMDFTEGYMFCALLAALNPTAFYEQNKT